jgi:hypothetical protein
LLEYSIVSGNIGDVFQIDSKTVSNWVSEAEENRPW